MDKDYTSKFDALNYNRDEIIRLLEKMDASYLLTKQEYEDLLIQIDFIKKSTSFNSEHIVETIIDSILKKDNIFDAITRTDDFVTNADLDARLYFFKEGIMDEIDEAKADKIHYHDDRYSTINHKHDGVYVTTEEIKNYVSKEYLDTVLSNLSVGGVNPAPSYLKPSINVKASVSSVPHKVETKVVLTPIYNQNDAGKITRFSVIKDSKVIYDSTQVSNIEVSLLLKHGEMATYVFKVEYEDGPIKNTISGVPYPDSSIKAGSIDVSFSINCVADSFVGTIGDKEFTIKDVENLTVIRNLSKKYSSTFTMDDNKIVYMYPRSFGRLSSVKDANNFEYINSYTNSILIYNDVEYHVYVLTYAVAVEGGFKQAFN